MGPWKLEKKESPPPRAERWPRVPDHLPSLTPCPHTNPCSQKVFLGNKPHLRQGWLLHPSTHREGSRAPSERRCSAILARIIGFGRCDRRAGD